MLKTSTALAALVLCGAAHLASAADTAAPAPATPAKQELAQQILKRLNMDAIGETMVGTPVTDALQQARGLLQGRVSTEKRDATMLELSGQARKFMAEVGPITRASADKLMPSTAQPMLTERFSEDELRQILAILDSPVRKKFEDLLPDMKKKLGESVAADTGPVVNPKLKSLQEDIGMRLRSAITP